MTWKNIAVCCIGLLGSAVFLQYQLMRRTPSRQRTSEAPRSEFGIVPVGGGQQGLGLHLSAEGVDIVFVHGLGSNPDTTWQASRSRTELPDLEVPEVGKQDVCWVTDLLIDDLPPFTRQRTRFFYYNHDSYWKREAVQTRLWNISGNMLHQIRENIRRTQDERSRKLILVGHSYGSLIIKQALVRAHADPNFEDIASQTQGILFLGTPHQGSDLTKFGSLLAWLLRPLGSNGLILGELVYNSLNLHDLHEQFTAVTGDKIRIYNFFEERQTILINLGFVQWPKFCVKEQSAKYFDSSHRVQNIGLAVDHSGLNKFGSRTAAYRIIRDKILGLLLNNPQIAPTMADPENVPVIYHAQDFETKTSHFTDRISLAEEIRHQLVQKSELRKVLVLWGITGAGKTEVAHSFIRSNKKDYTACFKVHGPSDLEFRNSLGSLVSRIPDLRPSGETSNRVGSVTTENEAQLLAQNQNRQDAESVFNWLNKDGNSRWLILIDNVVMSSTEPAAPTSSAKTKGSFTPAKQLYLTDYINRLKQGTIIITTQYSHLSYIYPEIEISNMKQSESLCLMSQTIGLSRNIPNSDLEVLIELLGNHAQSLACAANYIKKFKHIDAKAYITLWNECDPSIFEHEGMQEKRSIKTLTLALDKLDTISRQFFYLCAYLDPTCIWRGLFKPEACTSTWLGDLAKADAQFNVTLGNIGDLSLISSGQLSASSDLDSFSIHPAFHKAVQLILQNAPASTQEYINMAITIVGAAIPNRHESGYSDTLKILLPHAEQCRSNLDTLDEMNLCLKPSTLFYLGKIGCLYQDRGQLNEAIEFYDRALIAYENQDIFSENYRINKNYIDVMNRRGLIFMAQGRFSMAQRCFKKLLFRNTDGLSDKLVVDQSLLEIKVNFGLALRKNEEIKLGKQELNDALREYENLQKIYPTDRTINTQVFRVKQYLGVIYKILGDLPTATRYLKDARYGLGVEYEGESNLFVCWAAQELGSVLVRQNMLPEAMDQLQFALEGFESLCGPDNIFSLEAQWQKALWRYKKYQLQLLRDGKITEQERDAVCTEFETLIEKQERVLGSNDSLTLRSIGTFGQILMEFDNLPKADKCFRTAMARYDCREESQDHLWDRNLTAIQFAGCCDAQIEHGQSVDAYKEALDYLDEARQFFSKAVGDTAAKHLIEAVRDRTRIIVKTSSVEEQRKALEDLLSLHELDEQNRRWAEDRLCKLESK